MKINFSNLWNGSTLWLGCVV